MPFTNSDNVILHTGTWTNSVKIKVNGTSVYTGTSDTSVDISDYLSEDLCLISLSMGSSQGTSTSTLYFEVN